MTFWDVLNYISCAIWKNINDCTNQSGLSRGNSFDEGVCP